MAWVATAVVGTAVVGGIVQSNAAGDAAKATTRANQAAIAAGEAADTRAQEIRQPFVDVGSAAGGPLLELLGLQQNPEFGSLDAQISDLQRQIASGERAAEDASRAQAALNINAVGPGASGTKQIARDTVAGVSGSLGVGSTVDIDNLKGQLDALQSQRSGLSQFIKSDAPQSLEEINPVVDFLRKEGFEQIQESAAAGGRLGAGGTLKDLTQFNTDLTSTIVPQLQNQKFNQLFNLLGLGSNAASAQATGTQNTAVNTQNLLSGIGAAQSNAAIQQSNALTGALSSIPGAIGAFGAPAAATPPPSNFIGGPAPSTTTFTV